MKISNSKLLLISILVCVLLLEVFSAIIFNSLPEYFNNGKRIVEIYLGNEPEIKSKIEPHPYLLYQTTKYFSGKGFSQHNSLRYRNEEFDFEKDSSVTRILALGGSTTYMFPYVPNPKDTWVSQLESRLNEPKKGKFQVINAGLSYATTAELLASYVFRHQFLKPDILIIHTGGNDITPLFYENYNSEYTHFRASGSGLKPRKFENFILKISATIRLFYTIWLNTQETVYQSQPYTLDLVDREKALERVKQNESLGFRRNLETLVKMAKNDGVKVLLFGFLQAREENLATNKPVLKGLEKVYSIGLKKHYKIMKEISQKYEVPFVIPKQDLFEDSWFLDNCHLNEKGEKVKAEILFEYFTESNFTNE